MLLVGKRKYGSYSSGLSAIISGIVISGISTSVRGMVSGFLYGFPGVSAPDILRNVAVARSPSSEPSSVMGSWSLETRLT